MVGVKVVVTMERTLYIDVPDNITNEEVIKQAEKEIVLPVNALYTASQAMQHVGIKVKNLDLKDWNTTNTNYTVLKNE